MNPIHTTFLGYPAGFARPAALWLSLTALILGGLLLVQLFRRRASMSRWVSAQLAPSLVPGRSRRKLAARVLLSTVGLSLFGVALARPLLGGHEEEVKQHGVDVVVALDASKSMLARDVTPDRMTRAKIELETLLGHLAGDRVGLVTFAGSPFVQMPLTTDPGAARLFLRAVAPSSMPEGGTDVGGGLRLAAHVLDQAEHGSRERAVVLLTDGEDWGGDALAAAQQLRKEGIRLYVVGIGGPEGAPIPTARGYLTDAQGQTVITKLDWKGVQALAAAAGGEAFHDPNGVAMGSVIHRVDSMKKSELGSRRVVSYAERFQWPLTAGLLLMLAGVVHPETRRRRGRAAAAMAAALLACLWLTPRADAAEWMSRPDPATQRGIEAYRKSDWAGSLRAFDEAAKKSPGARAEYNRGTALFKLGRKDEAKQAFARAAAASPDARTLYDLGNAHAALEDKPGAIEAYRKSLAIDPRLEPARHNLEVLLGDEQKKQPEQQKKDQKQDQKKQDQNQQKQAGGGQNDQQKQQGGGGQKDQQKQAGNDQKDQKQQGNEQKDKNQQGQGDQQKQAGDEQKDQKQQGNEQKDKNQQGQGDQQKDQQKQAGNEQKNQEPSTGAANQQPKDGQQPGQPGQQAGQPGGPHRATAAERAAQAVADARLAPEAARVLDQLRDTERTLPLSKFQPNAPRRTHGSEKDW